jgi:NADH:ubiquinone oxidoreductase subunit E
MEIKVCMGSSCYLKGSFEVVRKLQELKENGADIELSGCLCFGKCIEGICVEIDGELVNGVSGQNIQPILDRIRR